MAHVRIIGPLAVALVISLSGCSSDHEGSADAPTTYRDQRLGIEASIPAAWQVIEKPITAVTYPRQVLAAASYPVRLEPGPPSCTPHAALDQMPRDGALLQVFEYNPGGGKVPRLPPRPARLTYADGISPTLSARASVGGSLSATATARSRRTSGCTGALWIHRFAPRQSRF